MYSYIIISLIFGNRLKIIFYLNGFHSRRDPESENFLENIFHICIDYRNRRFDNILVLCDILTFYCYGKTFDNITRIEAFLNVDPLVFLLTLLNYHETLTINVLYLNVLFILYLLSAFS